MREVILTKWGIWLILPIVMGLVAGVLERRLKLDTFSSPIPPLYTTLGVMRYVAFMANLSNPHAFSITLKLETVTPQDFIIKRN